MPSATRNALRTRVASSRGTALAELAIVMPLLMVLLLGMMDFGKAFNEWLDEAHLANEGARLAAVNYCPDATQSNCGWGDPNKVPGGVACPVAGTPQDACLAWYVAKDADIVELRKAATACATPPTPQPPVPGRCKDSYAEGQNAANVCITYPNGTGRVGDPVRVAVTVQYHWLNYLGSRISLGSQTLRQYATMRIESPVPSSVTISSTCDASNPNQYPGGAAGT